MHVFLVVVSIWSMAYRGNQQTPAFIQEMPSMAACQAVGDAMKRMANAVYDCVQTGL